MTEDTILLDRYIAEGDRAALEELFARHYGAVHRTILHMVHNSFDADDLAQATFLRAVKKSDQFDSSGTFRGWLLAIAVNQVRDFRRGTKRKREDQLFDMFAATGKDSDVPATGMRREFEQKLEQALETLSPELKDPLVLHYYEGMSFAEVGATLGLPKSTVQTRIRTSIRTLRQDFTQRGWVALLPTFDRLLELPTATGPGTGAMQTTRKAALWLGAAAALLTSIFGWLWWQSPTPPQSATNAGIAAATTDTTGALSDTSAATTTTERETVTPLAVERMVRGSILGSSGTPVANAEVRLHDYVSGKDELQQTGADGAFAFPTTVGRSDAFALTVRSSGHGHVILDSVVASEQPRDVRLAPEATVKVRVLDADGKPVPSCRVSAFRTPGEEPLAKLLGALPLHLRIDASSPAPDAEGRHTLRGLTAAPVLLVVQFDNEQPWLVADGESVVPGECDEQVVNLPRSGEYRIHVRDARTGNPVGTAAIQHGVRNGSWNDVIDTPVTATTEPGIYRVRRWISRTVRSYASAHSSTVRHLPEVDNLVITAPGYAASYMTTEQLKVDDDFVFDLERGVTIRGRTVDSQGTPLPGSRVIVTVDDEARETRISDHNGNFEWLALPAELELKIQSYRPDHSEYLSLAFFSLTTGEHRSVVMGGIANGAVLGSLKVRGEPVAGAVVDIDSDEHPDLQTLTDSNGRFRLDALPAGPITVSMWADIIGADGKSRHVSVQRKLHVQPGRNSHIHVDLRHEICGICIDAATNQPTKGVSVQAVPIGNPDAPTARDSSAADGTFHMFVEELGGYEVQARPASAWYSRRNPTCNVTNNDSPRELRLEVHKDPQTASIEVDVVGPDGSPITTSVFELKSPYINGDGKVLDGKLTLDRLRGGHYEVQLHDNRHVNHRFAFDITPGEKLSLPKIVMQRATSLRFIAPDADTPAHPSGMIDGDRILSWNSQTITHLQDLVAVMKALDGATAPLVVQRDGAPLELQVSKRLLPEAMFDFHWPYDFTIALQNRE